MAKTLYPELDVVAYRRVTGNHQRQKEMTFAQTGTNMIADITISHGHSVDEMAAVIG